MITKNFLLFLPRYFPSVFHQTHCESFFSCQQMPPSSISLVVEFDCLCYGVLCSETSVRCRFTKIVDKSRRHNQYSISLQTLRICNNHSLYILSFFRKNVSNLIKETIRTFEYILCRFLGYRFLGERFLYFIERKLGERTDFRFCQCLFNSTAHFIAQIYDTGRFVVHFCRRPIITIVKIIKTETISPNYFQSSLYRTHTFTYQKKLSDRRKVPTTTSSIISMTIICGRE